jgi:hypothetical protein
MSVPTTIRSGFRRAGCAMSTSTQPTERERTLLPRHRRGKLLAAAVIVVLVAVVIADAAGAFDGRSARSGGVSDNSYPTSLSTVIQGSLSSQITANGTLEYTGLNGSSDSVVNQASGTFSKLPSAGEVLSRGQVLYRVSNDPVVVLYGNTPAYRSLYEGDKGPDVRELNHNLVALGYATRSSVDWDWSYFSYETRYALEKFQYHLGEDETGSLSEGQVVFLPWRARINSVSATLGTSAGSGAPMMEATSTSQHVVVDLNASQQTEVKVGDAVQITLPDNQITPGMVGGIGTVAGGGSNATLPIYITLKHSRDAGRLDRAPVQVQITTAAVKHALIVPIDALLARSDSGYAVETVEAQGVRHLVAVTLGAFDDAAGTVQVTGNVSAGERIVVPNV